MSSRTNAPDFGILLALSFRVYVDELHAELGSRGFEDLRPSFGIVVRALHERPLTLTQLAEQMAVSKQAVAKITGEMLARGFIEQQGAEGDRRMKDLVLTARGRALMRAATEIGGRVEARLRREIGADAVAGMRTALEHLVVSGGGETEMRAKRSRPVW